MNELDQAQDEIKMLQERLATAQADNGHHVRQRGIDSERIDDLEEQLKVPRVELKDGDTIAKMTVEQHAELIAQKTSALQVKVIGLEGDLDVALVSNKQLHAQVEALKTGGQDDDSLLDEQRAALQAAENHREQLEEENDMFASTIAAQKSTINGLRNDIHDLKHEVSILNGAAALAR